MPVTLDDISKATGFSVPTVSRVLSNSSYPVSSLTRQRIQEVAQALGYRPNLSARSLRTERTNTIGILVDDIMSPFMPPLVRGIQDYLADHECTCVIGNSDWKPELERAMIESFLSRPVDGIIFAEYSHLATHEDLTQSQKPHLFVHRLFDSSITNSIVPDDYYGAALAVEHLITLGHRRIGYINGPETWHNSRDRLAGYHDTLQAHHLSTDAALIQPGDWEFDSGYAAAGHLLALPQRPTAIFAGNDLMALGAIYCIQDAGLSVPADMAVVGYDNRDFTKIFRPRITTVSLPVYEMGRAAAAQLLIQITNGQLSFEEIKVRGRLYVRETCGAPPEQRTRESPYITTGIRRDKYSAPPEN